jgi:hypothetical protein
MEDRPDPITRFASPTGGNAVGSFLRIAHRPGVGAELRPGPHSRPGGMGAAASQEEREGNRS